MAERSVRNAAVIGVGLLVAIAIAPGTRSAGRQGQSFPQRASQAESLTAWEKIAKVLQHPRCINCHQLKSPLQGDTGRPHIPRVVRGPDGHGVGVLRCGNCHDQTGANPTSGIPSAPNWGLAPVSMLWQGLSVGALCRQLKDPARNGNRSLDAIIEHMEKDQLVGYGWNPGPGRTPVPIPRKEFVDLMKAWVACGAACPQ